MIKHIDKATPEHKLPANEGRRAAAAKSVRYEVGRSEQLAERGRLVVDCADTTIGVFRIDGELFAYENICAHQGGPVCQGLIIPRVEERLNDDKASTGLIFNEQQMHIVCPWHGFEYNIKTGCHAGNSNIGLAALEVEEKEGIIYVTI